MSNTLGYAGRVALITGLAGFLLTFVTTPAGQAVRLLAEERGSSEISLSLLLLLLALVIGFLVTGISYRRNQEDAVIISDSGAVTVEQRSSWLARLVTATASGMLLFLATGATLFVIDILAPTLAFNWLVALTIVAVYASGFGFAIATWSANIDAVNLLILAALSGLTAIGMAALAVGYPLWWQRSLSFLGSTETAGLFFNVGIIIMGLIVLAINQETVAILKALVTAGRLNRDYFVVTRIYLILMPIFIMGIGLFPTRITPLSDFLHNVSSHLMLVLFLIMMWFTVNRRDSFHTRSFGLWSRIFAVFILVVFFLMVLDVVNFVAFQLTIFVPMGIWLMLYQLQVRDFAFKGQSAEMQPLRPRTALGIFALRASLTAAGLGALLAFVASAGQDKIALIDLTADVSVSRMLLLLGLVLGVGVTAFGYRRFVLEEPKLSEAERKALQGQGYWLQRSVIAATAGMVVFFLTALGIVFANQLFPEVAFIPSNVIAITTVYSGLLALALAYWAGNLSSVNLIVLAGITLILGVALGALTIGDPDWWTVSLSYLGSAANPFMGFFNYALLLTGLILLIANLDTAGLLHILSDDGRISPDYLLMVRWLLILIPLALIGVAIFPRRINTLFDVLHNVNATIMVVFFLVLAYMVVARADSFFRRDSVFISRLLAVAVVILYSLYVLNILVFVGMQLLLVVPIGMWLLLFQREVRTFARSDTPPADTRPDALTPDPASP